MSKFDFFKENSLTNSFGIVAEHKILGSNKIKVFPIESLSSYNDYLNKSDKSTKTSKNNITGSSKVEYTLEADWLDLHGRGSGSSPDVRRGELVLIWKVKDSNEYMWSTYKYQADLRGKETKVDMIGNTDVFGETLTDKNSHFTYNNPLKKVMGLKTANNDGEPVKFEFEIDYGKGIFTLKDSNGNSFKHDGKNGTLEATYNNTITLNAPNIILNGNTFITKALKVAKEIFDKLGLLTNHTHPPR